MREGLVLDRRYRLLEWVGEGQEGHVWRAEPLDRPHQPVAIKVFHHSPDAARVDQILCWHHPRVLRHHAHFVHQSHLCLVTDYADGGDASALLNAYPAGLPVPEVLRIIEALTSALTYLHHKETVHGDVKPKNVLFVNGRVCLGDLQLRAAEGGEAGLMATPFYAAPELWRGEAPSIASDIYALGATAFELLTGRPPFVGTPEALREAHLTDIPVFPADVDRFWVGLITRCLAKDPSDRPDTGALSQQFAALWGTPMAPRSVSPPPAPAWSVAKQAEAFEKGQMLYEQQRYAEALTSLEPAAQAGHAGARFLLAQAHRERRLPNASEDEALRLELQAAHQGLAEAQVSVARHYHNADTSPDKRARAVQWYRRAAKQGHPLAQYQLGLVCLQSDDRAGLGEGLQWLRQAAQTGYADAQFALGEALTAGLEEGHAPSEAFRWYQEAAQRGHAGAQCNLGWAYEHGHGTPADPAQSVAWYTQAAEAGLAAAQFNLAVALEEGFGGVHKVTEAIHWYRKAAEQNHPRAIYNLGLLYLRGAPGLVLNPERAREYCARAIRLDPSLAVGVGVEEYDATV